jgi:acyl carrier protein
MSVRERLDEFIRQSHWNFHGVRSDESLIASGSIDSLGFFNLFLWVEQEIGSHVDLTNVDLRHELSTLDRIVAFVEKHKAMKQADAPQ